MSSHYSSELEGKVGLLILVCVPIICCASPALVCSSFSLFLQPPLSTFHGLQSRMGHGKGSLA